MPENATVNYFTVIHDDLLSLLIGSLVRFSVKYKMGKFLCTDILC